MASLQQEVESLRRVPLFAALDPAKLKLLAFTSERLSFQAGQILFNQGDAGEAAYVVLSGKASILVGKPGAQICVATAGENDVVGEISVLCDVPRTATVKAETDLQTLKIDKEHFLGLIIEFPEMGIEVMRELADRLSVTTTELSKARNALKSAGIK